jgi:hypothetical protein
MTVTSKGRERWASELAALRSGDQVLSQDSTQTRSNLGYDRPSTKMQDPQTKSKNCVPGMGCFQEGRAARPDIQLLLSEKALSMVFTSRASIFDNVGCSSCNHLSRVLIQTHSADWPDAEPGGSSGNPQPRSSIAVSEQCLFVQPSRREKIKQDSCSNMKIVITQKYRNAPFHCNTTTHTHGIPVAQVFSSRLKVWTGLLILQRRSSELLRFHYASRNFVCARSPKSLLPNLMPHTCLERHLPRSTKQRND